MGDDSALKKPLFSPSGKRWILIVSALGIVAIAGTTLYTLKTATPQLTQPSPTPTPTVIQAAVSALGRLEPQGEVIHLAPPPSLGGAKVSKLLIREGDKVNKGQILAILDTATLRQAAVDKAEREVQVAQSQLAVVKAGAKTGEIEAQKAQIERLKAELAGERNTYQATLSRLNAELEGEKQEQTATIERLKAELADAVQDLQRYRTLAAEGVVSDEELQQRQLDVDQARERLGEAKARLNKTIATYNKQIEQENATFNQSVSSLNQQILQAQGTLSQIAEVREVDVQQAQAEVNRAIAVLNEVKADLAQSYVKSPIDGQVIKVHAYPGEKVDETDGILELGNTERMMVIAEVYESDINKVNVGQKAIIKSENDTFKQQLTGTVQHIGLQIGKKDVLDTDPAADIDVRVIEVKILLDPESSQQVQGLTYAKVIAEILLNPITEP